MGLAVQLLDRFLLAKLCQDQVPSQQEMRLTGLAACVIALKFSKPKEADLHRILRRARRSLEFSREQLIAQEELLLRAVHFRVYPQTTSSALLAALCANYSALPSADPQLVTAINGVISNCLHRAEFLKYAASTLAIAAVLYCGSMLQLDCDDWLRALPDACFSSPRAPSGAFDATECVDAIAAVSVAAVRGVRMDVSSVISPSPRVPLTKRSAYFMMQPFAQTEMPQEHAMHKRICVCVDGMQPPAYI